MRYALGDAQLDVVDSVRALGPCTTVQITQDTGRVDVARVVGTLVRRGLLIDYGRMVDLPCNPDSLAKARSRIGWEPVCLRSRDALGFRGRLCDNHTEDCTTWARTPRTRSTPSTSTVTASAAPSCSAPIPASAGT